MRKENKKEIVIILDGEAYKLQKYISAVEMQHVKFELDFWDYFLKTTFANFFADIIDLKRKKYDVNLNMLLTFKTTARKEGLQIQVDSYNVESVIPNIE